MGGIRVFEGDLAFAAAHGLFVAHAKSIQNVIFNNNLKVRINGLL